ncbi:MAG: DUF389 domain-containing protein [Cyanothece sp. SIO1E1]|nr:DUF389 domain-containing protein [Cyanothece sp. SIO1E1]
MHQIRNLLKLGLDTIPILKLRASLLKESRLTLNFIVLIISSCLIATFGLVVDSPAVIIGAMIIAPLMLPLRGFAFAALEGDLELLRNSFVSIVVGTLIGVTFAWLAGGIIGLPEFGTEVLARTQPTLIDLLIAIVAGGISGYAKIRPELGDALPGTAIAVALMPPICTVGLTLSQGQWSYSQGAFLLYVTNLLGITMACMLIYVLAGYARGYGKNSQLSRPLSWGVTSVLIILLIIPLGISLWQLIEQTRINDSIRRILVQASPIGERSMELLGTEISLDQTPPSILVIVRSAEPVTPEQVDKVETLIENQVGKSFKISFDVTQSIRVEAP